MSGLVGNSQRHILLCRGSCIIVSRADLKLDFETIIISRVHVLDFIISSLQVTCFINSNLICAY